MQDNPSPEIKAANLMTPLVAFPQGSPSLWRGTLRESEVAKTNGIKENNNSLSLG